MAGIAEDRFSALFISLHVGGLERTAIAIEKAHKLHEVSRSRRSKSSVLRRDKDGHGTGDFKLGVWLRSAVKLRNKCKYRNGLMHISKCCSAKNALDRTVQINDRLAVEIASPFPAFFGPPYRLNSRQQQLRPG
jgi:hypothetical protein